MPGLSFMYNLNCIMSISVKPKKRGRPATGRDPLVAIRMPPDLTAAIDTFAAEHEPPASRSEAVRALVSRQLIAMGRLSADPLAQGIQEGPTEAAMVASAVEVRSQAANAADEAMSGMDATQQEKASRRGALTDEPAVVEAARAKTRGQKSRQ